MRIFRTIFIAILFIFLQTSVFAQIDRSEGIGGKFLPSEGIVRALFIFAQFTDDKYSVENSKWKVNNPPDYIHEFVDHSEKQNSRNGNLTHYFDEMSGGKFKLIGRSIYLTTPQSRQWYFENKKSRWFINKDLILKADSLLDFQPFDNITRETSYKFKNKPDGIVDMIFIIYRNIAYELPSEEREKIEKQFGLIPGGEASLGYSASFTVDNGLRTVEMGYPGSGLNIKAKLHEMPISGCAHEFGHYLLGGNEMHFTSGMYGLMSSWGYTQRSIMMNGWEMYKLDWLKTQDIGPEKGSYRNIKIDDFLTTNSAVRILIPDSKEYFILENHQQVNKIWDIPDQSNTNIRGIYVLRQSGNYGNSVSLICADGRWDWEVVEKTFNPYGGKDSLPVFKRIARNDQKGRFDNEMIPYKFRGEYKADVIHFYKDPETGKVVEKAVFRGDGDDHFDLERNQFSDETNPSSKLSNGKPSGVEFTITGKRNNGDLGESYLLDITIK